MPLIVSVAVAGYELTELGLTPQLPAPYVVAQLNATAASNPSCEVIEIGPLVPVPPTFTSGNGLGSVTTKSGLVVTFSVNDTVGVAEVPAVVAARVTG